jgi:lipopolysaccharide/colanic/teichoic acid biosynthesis glycosyltransferase
MSKLLAPTLEGPVRPKAGLLDLVAILDQVIKRLLDICVTLVCLLMLAPFFFVVAVRIKRDSPGPIFYRGRRIGRHGKEFLIVKFRTMSESPESYSGAKVTAENDPRITPFGRWLRDTKLNELPQLWNVLRGEMSLVGPRPEDPEIVATWPEDVRREVLSVRPGVTSPASVLYRNEEALLNNGNVMQTYLQSILPSKLRLDQLYVRHRSLMLDLDVLFWTALLLIPQLRSFVPKEDTLFLGPLSQFGRRYLNWFMIDTVITFVAIATTGAIWRLYRPLDVGWGPALLIAFGFAFLFSLVGVALGINRVAWSQAWASESLGLVLAVVLAAGIALGINQIGRTVPLLPPGMILSASALALVGFISVRYRSRLTSGLVTRWLASIGSVSATRERVLIVGSGHTGQFVAWLLGDGNSLNAFHVVGFVDDDLYKQGMRYHGISVIGRRADICRLVEQHDVGIIIFAIHNISSEERGRLLEICESTSARLVQVPDIAGALNAVVLERARESSRGPHMRPASVPNDPPLYTSRGIPTIKAQLWLADLERSVQAGDLDAVRDQIRLIREEMREFLE